MMACLLDARHGHLLRIDYPKV